MFELNKNLFKYSQILLNSIGYTKYNDASLNVFDIENKYKDLDASYNKILSKISNSLPDLKQAYITMNVNTDNSYKTNYINKRNNIDILFAELVLLENSIDKDLEIFQEYNKQLQYRIHKKNDIYNELKDYYIKTKHSKDASKPRFQEFDYLLKQSKLQIFFYISIISVFIYLLWKKKVFGIENKTIAENLGNTIKTVSNKIT